MRKYGSIYIIRNKINHKVYIGQTTMCIKDRFKAHIKKSTINNRRYKLYNAFRKYGIENFYIELLEENIPIEELNDREIFYIEKYDSYENGYNSTKGGDGRVINKKYDELKIIELYQNGKSSIEIGEIYNVSEATISRVLKKNNIKTRQSGNKYQQFDKEKFKGQWFGNYSLLEMSKSFNCSPKTIKRYALKIGLPPKNKNLYKDEKGRFKRSESH